MNDKYTNLRKFTSARSITLLIILLINSPSTADSNTATAKKFMIECDHPIEDGEYGQEVLIMKPGEIANCTLTITDFIPNTFTKVTTNLKDGIMSSIMIDPTAGVTNERGKLVFAITAIDEGINWIAWAIPNENGKREFNKSTYDNGYARGMFVEVRSKKR
ncbi:MAG: hypothetical protein ACUZ8H_16565 [Candidatus Anammoxibacter sp.]